MYLSLPNLDQKDSKTMRAFIEGPYGGIGCGTMAKFDNILVITGGSGAGFSLSVVEDVLRRHAESHATDSSAGKALRIVFATHSSSMAHWYADEVKSLLSCYASRTSVSVSVHTTSNSGSLPDSTCTSEIPSKHGEVTSSTSSSCIRSGASDIEKGVIKADKNELTGTGNNDILHHLGRPTLGSVVSSLADDAAGKTAGIAVCGPPSMLHDVRNAAAGAQRSVLRGDLKELYLHTESFS
ncbi:hypothetical protein FQN49_001813 [Arthroderma sp. PD_2]|nr:hypothetical protein FQN49_001813 [Arthroderma sp. PD_2]